ncbi:MBL fold metallo-hydrolase [Labilithrix luteola]|nr:MBL fold metallo-hydrolase [Labilithrix luteola]
MMVHFWGVRGSIASPGAATAGVGGNTSCVEVVCGETRIVLDAGTGLRGLGSELMGRQEPLALTLLLSHYHWDHIQGLPFFAPLYMKDAELTIVGARGTTSIRETLHRQMSAPVFPVRLDEVGAKLETREVTPGSTFAVGEATVRVARGNHPGGVLAYRIEHQGRSIVYATDTEHYACVDPALRALAEGADVLIYDAQYTPEEYANKVGWGHSTFLHGTDLARSAGAGGLVLFHHDPARSDARVLEIEARAREYFPASMAAREGMQIDLANARGAQAA